MPHHNFAAAVALPYGITPDAVHPRCSVCATRLSPLYVTSPPPRALDRAQLWARARMRALWSTLPASSLLSPPVTARQAGLAQIEPPRLGGDKSPLRRRSGGCRRLRSAVCASVDMHWASMPRAGQLLKRHDHGQKTDAASKFPFCWPS